MSGVAKLLYELLPELRAQNGNMSRMALSFQTVRQGFEGVSAKTIESWEMIPGRLPKAHALRAVADALNVSPEVFYEWPIALAQEGRPTATSGATQTLADVAEEAGRRRTSRQTPRDEDPPDTRQKGRGA